MQRFIACGNLTGDPVVRQVEKVDPETAEILKRDVCTFRIGVRRKSGARRGEDNPRDFFKIVVWGEYAKVCAENLRKGSRICVCGKITLETFTNDDGRQYANMRIFPDEIEFCGKKITPEPEPEEVEPDGMPF